MAEGWDGFHNINTAERTHKETQGYAFLEMKEYNLQAKNFNRWLKGRRSFMKQISLLDDPVF